MLNSRHSALGEHAVVLGAGVARSFELDAFSPAPTHRSGTPQDRHTHALLRGGLEALDELFPGFARDPEQAAVPMRVGFDVRYDRPGFDSFPQRDFGWHQLLDGAAAAREVVVHAAFRSSTSPRSC